MRTPGCNFEARRDLERRCCDVVNGSHFFCWHSKSSILKVICANSPRLRASLIKNTVEGGSHTEVENRIIIVKKAKKKKMQCRKMLRIRGKNTVSILGT